MRHLIIGMGEVGNALKKIFPDAVTYDLNDDYSPVNTIVCDVIHICFPYDDDFVSDVAEYKRRYGEEALLIIHATVPVGTSDKVGAVYSPIRGVHPNLEKGIRTFIKYFAGGRALEAGKIFRDVSILTRVIADTRTLEAAKLWDTTAYGVMLLLEKEIWDWCHQNGVEFEIVYREFTETYNMGYTLLGMPHVLRPFLMHFPGKIGGHCVVENAAFLDSPSARRIISENKHYESNPETFNGAGSPRGAPPRDNQRNDKAVRTRPSVSAPPHPRKDR